VSEVFAGRAGYDDDGGDVGGQLDRLCNGAVVETLDPTQAIEQALLVKGVCWDDGTATFVTTPGPLPEPRIEHDGANGDTQPPTGFIDPRDDANGYREAMLRFSRDVFRCDGSSLDGALDAFVLDETGTAAPPNIVEVSYIDGDESFVHVGWDRPITIQEWTTLIVANVCDAAGTPIESYGDLGPGVEEPDRLDVGALPLDVNQDNCVTPFDLLVFRQILNTCLPDCSDYIGVLDINRDGAITPFDLLRFRQLSQDWLGECMNHEQP
jgi:hypothetical protein